MTRDYRPSPAPAAAASAGRARPPPPPAPPPSGEKVTIELQLPLLPPRCYHKGVAPLAVSRKGPTPTASCSSASCSSQPSLTAWACGGRPWGSCRAPLPPTMQRSHERGGTTCAERSGVYGWSEVVGWMCTTRVAPLIARSPPHPAPHPAAKNHDEPLQPQAVLRNPAATAPSRPPLLFPRRCGGARGGRYGNAVHGNLSTVQHARGRLRLLQARADTLRGFGEPEHMHAVEGGWRKWCREGSSSQGQQPQQQWYRCAVWP